MVEIGGVDVERVSLYRCCNTCIHKDNSFYVCSKAEECFNGFSAYAPNAEIQKQENRIIKKVIKRRKRNKNKC